MKLRKIGAIIAGVALLGSTLAAAQEVPPEDFFINPETGDPAVVLVVGKTAATMDVVSATMLATALGATSKPEAELVTMSRAKHHDVDLLFPKGPDEVAALGFPTVDVPDPALYRKWEHNSTFMTYPLPLWYFDDIHKFWGNGDGDFQPWETHEEIQVRFDYHDAKKCGACLSGGDTTIHTTTTLSDFTVPGLIYRADNIFAPPMVMVDPEYSQPTEVPFFSADLGPYTVLFMPEPWIVVHNRLPQFKLFNTVYTVIDAGPVLDIHFQTGEHGSLHGTPYIITGEPHFESPVYIYKDEPVDFSVYTVEVKEVDVDRNKAQVDVYIMGELLESFWIEMPVYPTTEKRKGFSAHIQDDKFPFDDYEPCEDSNNNGVLDPGEMTSIIMYDCDSDGEPDFHKWMVDQVGMDMWADYTWWYYTDDMYENWVLFNAVDFVIQGIRVFISSKNTAGIEATVYWVENKKWWYNRLCSDPWTAKGDNHQMLLDVCESGWDDPEYEYQPPGTGLWPPAGFNMWSKSTAYIGNGFLDTNDGHIGVEYTLLDALMYFPEQNDLDRDSNTTIDCRDAHCINLPDVEDPVTWHGPGQPVLELNVYGCTPVCADSVPWEVPGPSRLSYFTVEVTDTLFSCGDADGLSYDTVVQVNPGDSLVMMDSELDFEKWKSTCEYNLILIGGPVANSVVKNLVDEGISTVDWATSPGEWEYFEGLYNTCGILIVAGADREATHAAVLSLIKEL